MLTQNGKVIFVGSVRTGVNGKTAKQWHAQEFVIETIERFPVKMAWRIFGEDLISKIQIREGEIVNVCGYPESHEYGGQWYTELRCTDVLDGNLSRVARLPM